MANEEEDEIDVGIVPKTTGSKKRGVNLLTHYINNILSQSAWNNIEKGKTKAFGKNLLSSTTEIPEDDGNKPEKKGETGDPNKRISVTVSDERSRQLLNSEVLQNFVSKNYKYIERVN